MCVCADCVTRHSWFQFFLMCCFWFDAVGLRLTKALETNSRRTHLCKGISLLHICYCQLFWHLFKKSIYDERQIRKLRFKGNSIFDTLIKVFFVILPSTTFTLEVCPPSSLFICAFIVPLNGQAQCAEQYALAVNKSQQTTVN